MGELAQEYEGQVRFNVIPAEETARRQEEIESYGFAELRHGLVGFGRHGQVRVKIPGHQFGKPRIEEAVETVLSAGG